MTVLCYRLLLCILGAMLIVSDATNQRARRSASAIVNKDGKIDTRAIQGSNSGEGSSSGGSSSSVESSSTDGKSGEGSSSEGSSSSSEESGGSSEGYRSTEASSNSSRNESDGDSFKNLKNNETNEYDVTYWKSFLASTEASDKEDDARACGNIADRYCFNAPYKCTDIGGVLDDDYDCDEDMFCCDLSGAE